MSPADAASRLARRVSRQAAVAVPTRRPPLWSGQQGFRQYEHGLEWHPNKEALLKSGPGAVVVASSYEYQATGSASARQVRKYSSFASHCDYWNFIERHNESGLPHNLHEVFLANGPRCLYFDLDGGVGFKQDHSHITMWLRHFVRWFFIGDHMGWDPDDPDAVVLASPDPQKYSCHVVFPQIQFADFQEQQAYVSVLMAALPALEVKLEGGESVPILSRVVDRVPYTNFQLFRGPYACKLGVGGRLRADTCLEPEGFFRSNPLACFAGHADADHALKLPALDQLLRVNEEVRHFHEQQQHRAVACSGGRDPTGVSLHDVMCLYLDEFQMKGGGVIDFAGLTDVQVYEAAMKYLNPERASQWWSWFRVSSVTYSMLRKYQGNETACARIWDAHLLWSRKYPYFDEAENVEMVMRCERSEMQGKKLSSLPTLVKMVRFDNPDMHVREATWRWTMSSGSTRSSQALAAAGWPDDRAALAGPGGAATAA